MFRYYLYLVIITFLLLVVIGLLVSTVQSTWHLPSDSRTRLHSTTIFVVFFYFALAAMSFFKGKFSLERSFLLLLVSLLTIHSFTIYLNITGEIGNIPLTILNFLGIVAAYFYLRLKGFSNLIPFGLCCLFLVFMLFDGWDYWQHKSWFGRFTPRIAARELPTKFEAFDRQKNLVTDDDFKSKVVILDFWHTSCGLCFEKFPYLQSGYEKYKDNPSVAIFAVNTPFEDDKSNQAFEMIEKRGYTFPVIVARDEILAEKFAVVAYPTTFVINKGQIVGIGDIKGSLKMVDELLNTNSLAATSP